MAPNTISQEQSVRKRLSKKAFKSDSDSSDTSNVEPKMKRKSAAQKSSVWSSVGWMTIGCLLGSLLYFYLPAPQLVRQLAQLKRQLTSPAAKPSYESTLVDSRPVDKVPEPEINEDGEVYEYHQFMAAVEQNFDNVR
jgi:hypothetical protein